MRCAHTPAKCIATHGSAIAQGGPCGNSQEDHFENFFIAVVLPGLSIHMALVRSHLLVLIRSGAPSRSPGY
jgi:hypothetical protein